MDIMAGITAASQGLKIAKALRGIEKNYDDATYRAQMAELIESLTDAKLAMAEAKEGLVERDNEIKRLKANFEAKSALVKADGGYDYLAGDEGKAVGYPVCPKCNEVDGRISQTKEHENSGKSRCPACSSIYHPVVCYLPSGSGYETKQAKESAEYSRAVFSAGSRNRYSDY